MTLLGLEEMTITQPMPCVLIVCLMEIVPALRSKEYPQSLV